MRHRRKKYREWFEFSAAEQRGAVILTVMIIALIITRIVLKYFIPPAAADFHITDEVQKWLLAQSNSEFEVTAEYHTKEDGPMVPLQLFRFDPNSISDQQWSQLGLSPRQIKGIRNYLNKGGKFVVRNDLAKMYSLTEEDFQRLEPYVDLPEQRPVSADFQERNWEKWDQPAPEWKSQSPYSREYPSRQKTIIDLNTADTTELKSLRGIGSWLAKKIVNYRERLGGFHSADQLLEVYRMTPEKLDTIRDRLVVDPHAISLIHINSVSLDQLLQHPYLTRTQSTGFISYRDKHGPFHAVEEIRKCLLIDEKTFEKLRIYLTVD